MNYQSGSGFRNAWKSDGTEIVRDVTTQALTLPAGTYYIVVGGPNAVTPSLTALVSLHLSWSAALAATITIEDSNMPKYFHGNDSGPIFTSDYEAATTAGNWIPENPSTAIVSTVGTSNTSTAATVTAGGAAAGGCLFHLGNEGARRIRAKIIVTVQGTLVANVSGKVGA